ncbi:MAG: aryl-sulfate sulfotransferase [Saprospiraceae bacterium]
MATFNNVLNPSLGSFIQTFLLFFAFVSNGQQTVGLISIDQAKSIGGYNLIYPDNQPHVFLLNECGEIVNTWEDAIDARPGKTAYLLENGDLLKCKTSGGLPGVSFGVGGAGGIIEIYSWENELQWSYQVADSLNRQHHDVHFMENGNVLMIVWERISFDEIIENGFDTLSNPQESLWPDYILEVNPNTNERVWEWHAWDHLVQDFDSTKLNFGTVSEHPELIDLNYQKFTGQREDLMHANSIDYDPVKDQIILSVRNYNEIWIIDHSTTTAEAASHAGGNGGKGGDLLYRWGNPEAYKMGSPNDRKLFVQHDAQWIDEFVDADYEHFGKIILYNNLIESDLSLGQILAPVWDSTSKTYAMQNGVFLPQEFTSAISHPDTSKNFSGTASSIQVIGDGYIVMCASVQGLAFELTPQGEVAWEYKVPLKNGFPIPQGFELSLLDNFTFRCERYPENYAGFIGKDLSPKGYIELEPDVSNCMFTNVQNKVEETKQIKLYPNPVSDYLHIEMGKKDFQNLEIINQYGQVYFYSTIIDKALAIDASDWPKGVYFLMIDGAFKNKFIVQ